jgi:hypothetical protein
VPLLLHEQWSQRVRDASQTWGHGSRRTGRYRRLRTSILAGCAATLCSGIALGAPHDDVANKLIKKAMYEDYVETNFAESGKKLEEALALCQSQFDCSSTVRARILCDLGVVEFALQRQDEGRGHFARAVLEDPKVAIEPDFSTPDLQRELAAVKGQSAPAPPAEAAPPPEHPLPPPAKPSGQSADCPPDFPGCTPAAATCTSDDECSPRQTCTDGACSSISEPADDLATMPYKKNWVSLGIQQDLLLLPGASNACAGGTGYACFSTSSDAYYASPPVPNGDDLVNAGAKPATTSILAGLDRAVSRNVLLGIRLGYVLGGGPTRPGASSFLPVHAEARVAYWFGTNPLARAGFRFYLVVAGGLAEVDASQTIDVYTNIADAMKQQNSIGETAWKKTGNGFAAAGGGTMFAITPDMGILVEVKAMEMFPTLGTGFSGQLGYAIGF